jgi:ribosomal protein S18 acetylase RimI-like enzyme
LTVTDRSLQFRRSSPDEPIAKRLILALNAELEERYPEDGANHFRLETDEVSGDRGVFLVAYLGEEPIACGAIRRLGEEDAEIKRMYVDPGTRGSGVGRRMLDELVSHGREFGAKRIVLETGKRQIEALALYKRAGFEPIPRFGEYANSPFSLCLAKDLR